MGLKKMKSGLNVLRSNSNGLILWENDARGLGTIKTNKNGVGGMSEARKSLRAPPS